MTRRFILFSFAALVLVGSTVESQRASAQVPAFHRTLTLNLQEPLTLNIELSRGDVEIGYSREGQLSIYSSGKNAAGKSVPEEFFDSNLMIEQKENRVTIHDSILVAAWATIASISYKIDVPYRTEVHSAISGAGNQKVLGITGPAELRSGSGDIHAEYVTFAALEAITGKGNITCTRVAQVTAQTDDGNITLLEDGTSKATVSKGRGKIEVAGARGSFEGSTDHGDLHIKAVLKGDWLLHSTSGNIRVELPPKAKFEVDANAPSGGIFMDRDGMQEPIGGIHQLQQQINGGGQRLNASTINGNIFIN